MPQHPGEQLSRTADEARLLKLATSAAVFTATLLILTKLTAYLFTQSVSVLASLVDSLMDVGASFINLLAVRYSLQPPDAEHRFGHPLGDNFRPIYNSYQMLI